MFYKFSTVCVLLFLTLSPCSAQAPGDENERCTGDDDAPTYPDTVRNLMDSYNYVQLLPGSGTGNTPIEGAVWTDRSVDGNDAINTTHPTYWQHGGGGICRFQVRVCGWQRDGGQDNWLFTQHISQDFDPNTYNYPVEIHVELVHALSSCRRRFGCDPTFRLYYYTTNTTQLPITGGSGFMNTDNYVRFARAKPADTIRTFTKTFNFTLQPNVTGFYFAIRDNGTCVGISRVRVYRDNCQSFQSGLVIYPDTPANITSNVSVPIQCVPGSSRVPNRDSVTCRSDGTWVSENPACECHLGYEDRETECFKCPAGKYRSAVDTTCQPCPDNTVMDQEGVAICECLDGYFRNDENRMTDSNAQSFVRNFDEPPSTKCSQPPSTPRDPTVVPEQTSIVVRWSSPTSTGGRSDLYYQVEHSDPDNLGTYTGTVYLNGGSTSHLFTGLKPYTQYCVQVTAHNGVSDQDPDGTNLRTVEECTRTLESEPGPVKELSSVYPVILWQPPDKPNGVIQYYELNFTRDGQTKTLNTDDDQTYFIITKDTVPGSSGTFDIECGAINGAGRGASLCKLTVDPEERSLEPNTCLLCPEQTVGLVYYPATGAPESGTVDVVTECVKNAEQTSNDMTVTCDSTGSWGNENPQCQCREGTMSVTENECTGPTSPTPSDSPKCLTCPEGIFIAESCDVVYVIWKPVSGAELYKLQFLENNKGFLNATTKEIVFNISVNDSKFENKIFSVEIGTAFSANGEVEGYSEPVEVNIKELLTKCGGTERSSDGGEDIDPVPLAIAVVVTFAITALAVSFLATVIGLVVNGRRTKKEALKNDYTLHSVNEDNKF